MRPELWRWAPTRSLARVCCADFGVVSDGLVLVISSGNHLNEVVGSMEYLTIILQRGAQRHA